MNYWSTWNYDCDVCLILEGCYPYVSGGVSSWTQWLLQQQSHLRFSVVSILPCAEQLEMKYKLPKNVVNHSNLYLHQPEKKSKRVPSGHTLEYLVKLLIEITQRGNRAQFAELVGFVNYPTQPVELSDLLNSPLAWEIVKQMYGRTMPYASFLHYFWAWRALFGGLFATLRFELPRARVYHTVSTGYAGLLAARAHIETGRPAIITEHGIYTNERRIEILMAEWVADVLDKGLSISDGRYDLRDMWINTFEQYARICYGCCDKILTLYDENQKYQLALDANPLIMQVIPNGIDLQRFEHLPRSQQYDPPTIALIGRVVPIKDVKTFINAVNFLRKEFPNLRALVIGPTNEDPAYYAECQALVCKLQLDSCIHFTGMVRIEEYLPQIHVNVLTSVSEAQPLAVLEAGAVGIPSVTTDVGSCRELLEGRKNENPRLGLGGIITDLVSAADTARGVKTLLRDHAKRKRYGDALQARVRRYYNSDEVSQSYTTLYNQYCAAYQ
jgi:glycosyltransferase involved in cell wall biosynthesis